MVAVDQGKVPYRIRFASMRLIKLRYKDSRRLRWSEPDANFRNKAGFVGPGFGFEAWVKAGPAGGLTCWEGGGGALEAGPWGGGPRGLGVSRSGRDAPELFERSARHQGNRWQVHRALPAFCAESRLTLCVLLPWSLSVRGVRESREKVDCRLASPAVIAT